jgi:hypothetical protein
MNVIDLQEYRVKKQREALQRDPQRSYVDAWKRMTYPFQTTIKKETFNEPKT